MIWPFDLWSWASGVPPVVAEPTRDRPSATLLTVAREVQLLPASAVTIDS